MTSSPRSYHHHWSSKELTILPLFILAVFLPLLSAPLYLEYPASMIFSLVLSFTSSHLIDVLCYNQSLPPKGILDNMISRLKTLMLILHSGIVYK